MELNNAHLTYCTNIHAGENWVDHFSALKKHFPSIKKSISNKASMGIGLRLSNLASLDLEKGVHLSDFKKWLLENNAYVFTMNGFPYGNFHHGPVKDHVHSPDWTTAERVNYTIRLFKILEKLLPAGMEGGISTSPLSYRLWFKNDLDVLNAKEIATINILKITEHLITVRQQTSTILHLDIEPEPDGLLETGKEFIEWFDNYLIPLGKKIISKKFNVSLAEAEKMIKDHICICYDVCHFAIGYESHAAIINDLDNKGIKVGKIQISAALKSMLPANLQERKKIKENFSKFNEPTYLHQVVARCGNNMLRRYKDLPDALKDNEDNSENEWRAHFHVPVFMEDFGLLQSTQKDIIEVIELQNLKPFTRHLEVETYTWEVIPETLKLPIEESIIRELQWVVGQLTKI